MCVCEEWNVRRASPDTTTAGRESWRGWWGKQGGGRRCRWTGGEGWGWWRGENETVVGETEEEKEKEGRLRGYWFLYKDGGMWYGGRWGSQRGESQGERRSPGRRDEGSGYITTQTSVCLSVRCPFLTQGPPELSNTEWNDNNNNTCNNDDNNNRNIILIITIR